MISTMTCTITPIYLQIHVHMFICDKWKQRPDQDINVQYSGNFNRETGLWNFKSLSTHKPFETSMDPGLIFGTQREIIL